MEKIFLAVITICLFSACKETPESFKPTCTNVTLEKVDSNVWKYCYVSNFNIPVKNNDKSDTLTFKILKHIEDVNATIYPDSKTEFCISLDSVFVGKKDNGKLVNFRYLAALNLPECFKKEKLKVLISGDLRIFPDPLLSELNCGELFELTKIREIP